MYYMYSVGHVTMNLSERYIHSNLTMMAVIKHRDYAHLDLNEKIYKNRSFKIQLPNAQSKKVCLLVAVLSIVCLAKMFTTYVYLHTC